jgi:hypothetical protein
MRCHNDMRLRLNHGTPSKDADIHCQKERRSSQNNLTLSRNPTVAFQFAKPLSRNNRRRSIGNTPKSTNRKTLDQPNHPRERRKIMTTTSKNVHRPTISLALPKAIPALIQYGQGIVKRMTGNPHFPNPTPTLTAVVVAINELQIAESGAQARTKGAVVLRNEKRTALVGVLQQLRSYIQSIADEDATNAASIIESAGVAVRKTPTRHARVFAARQGHVSGVANVVAAVAGRRASYDWEYSTDGGKTWVTLPSTLQAKTTVAGLTPGSTVQFKYRAVTKTGETDWSQPVSLMVH